MLPRNSNGVFWSTQWIRGSGTIAGLIWTWPLAITRRSSSDIDSPNPARSSPRDPPSAITVPFHESVGPFPFREKRRGPSMPRLFATSPPAGSSMRASADRSVPFPSNKALRVVGAPFRSKRFMLIRVFQAPSESEIPNPASILNVACSPKTDGSRAMVSTENF